MVSCSLTPIAAVCCLLLPYSVGAFASIHPGKTGPSTLERWAGTTSIVPANLHITSRRHSAILAAAPDDLMYSDSFSVPLLLVAALGVGIAAQTFINQMLEGDQGLGAFLTDGGGFNKSGFRPTKDKDAKTDPLPWLKLPELDFVEVAGQEKIMSEAELMMKLERLRENMKNAVDQGRLQEAESLRKELEQTMETYGVEFTSDEA